MYGKKSKCKCKGKRAKCKLKKSNYAKSNKNR